VLQLNGKPALQLPKAQVSQAIRYGMVWYVTGACVLGAAPGAPAIGMLTIWRAIGYEDVRDFDHATTVISVDSPSG